MAEQSKEQLKKIKDLIEEINICMFTTWDKAGKLRGRPMSVAQVDDEGGIWFFTNEYSGKVEEISKQNEVFLTFASKGSSNYLTVNAIASLSDDKAKMEELWNPSMKIWFPEGLNDPKILLIKLDPSEAEYWESATNKVMMLYGMAKAFITGEEYKEGKHDKVNL